MNFNDQMRIEINDALADARRRRYRRLRSFMRSLWWRLTWRWQIKYKD